MKKAGVETLYFETGSQNPVTLRVASGEEFEVQTQLNRGPWLDDHPDGASLKLKVNDGCSPKETMYAAGWSMPGFIPSGLPSGNPSSGCIYVEGAQIGDMLRIHIGDIEIDPLGFTSFRGSNGAVPSWFGPSPLGSLSRIVEIKNGKIAWNEGLQLPVKPMIGLIGVAPRRERIGNNWAGYWGGNMDAQEITSGSTLMLGVHAEGGLLHVGDMHALQGDGEICGSGGIECSGRVRMRVEVSECPKSLYWPRVEDATHISVIAMARPLEDAMRSAIEGLVLWMAEDYGFSRGEAFLLLGQVLEARCTAIVNPTYTYIAKIGKQYLKQQSSV